MTVVRLFAAVGLVALLCLLPAVQAGALAQANGSESVQTASLKLLADRTEQIGREVAAVKQLLIGLEARFEELRGRLSAQEERSRALERRLAELERPSPEPLTTEGLITASLVLLVALVGLGAYWRVLR